jgi:hypothetical protein
MYICITYLGLVLGIGIGNWNWEVEGKRLEDYVNSGCG